MKKIACLLLTCLCLAAASAQSSIRLGVLTGISCVPCAYLIENKEKLAVQGIEFQIFNSEQTELPKLLRGELDMGFLLPEDAAKVFSAGNAALRAVAVVQNENLSLLTSDESYKNLSDLRGKTVLCQPRESKIFVPLLEKKQIPFGTGSDSANFDFSVPTAGMANKLILGEGQYALLSEPFASVAILNSQKIRRAQSVRELYAEVGESSSFPAMLLVVRADFAKEHRDVVRRFCDLYKNALSWTTKNPTKAAFLSEKHQLGLSDPLVRTAIPSSALTFREMKSAQSDFEALLTIFGRNLPDKEFYF